MAREVIRFEHRLPGQARPLMTLEVLCYWLIRPVRGTLLFALLDDFYRLHGLGGVGKLLEVLASLWVSHRLSPFAEITVHESLHLLLHFCGDAKFVVYYHLSKIVDPSREAFEPSCCSLEFVCCADIEDQIAIDYWDDFFGRYISCKQFRMARLCTTVASYVNIEAFIRGY